MRVLTRTLPPSAGRARSFAAVTASSGYGRTAAYRRLCAESSQLSSEQTNISSNTPSISSYNFSFLRSRLRPEDLITQSLIFQFRSFHNRSYLYQEAAQKKKEEPSTKPASDAKAEDAASEGPKSGEGPKQEGEQQSEGETDGKQKQEKKDAPPPPPHGDKTPWQVFTETLKTEFKASKEWNESTKALASGVNDFTQNEHIRKAREAYSKVSETTGGAAAKTLKTTGKVIGQGAAWTWETPVVKGVRKGVTAAARGVEKVTEPVRKTEAYKSVANVIDDGSSSKYGGWVEKEERRKRREAREAEELKKYGGKRPQIFEEDPNAGTNITLHKDAKWKESWRDFRDSNPVMQRLFNFKSTYAESENPLIITARSISDRVAGFFAENETAMVIKKFKEMDPTFQLEPFLQEMREYILPEVLDAYVKGDVETLKLWLSAAQYQVYAALMQQYTTAGLKSDGRILDIRHVDILSARMVEPGEIPVFIITCRTQEVHTYRNAKTGELAAGMEDKVQQVTYAIGVTRIPEEVSNPETRGWRMIELQKSGRDYI
ncbi:TIM44 subunit of mitochondria import inner membrane translocase [Patellaria atrata CBS 101060]|uniref:Mitochondrial import inner membrane translocase subunit TIM44 n=1 Tax=Patellaria atrata CBS 101060 TaxID=1346257 RepID=A0A9P4SGY9_9PEZI|nr:TIM44 subunit of mitochondria import inner membrane translocase [Patellaria atrata CBS 101060]